MKAQTILNAVNSSLVLLLAVALAAAATIVALVSADAISPEEVAPGGWIQRELDDIDALTGGQREVSLGAAIGAAVTGAFLLGLQSLPLWRAQRLYGTDTKGNRIMLDARSVKLVIEGAIRRVSGVEKADVSLRRSRSGLEILCRAKLSPRTNIAEIGRELEENIEADVVAITGVKLSAIHLELSYEKTAGRIPAEREVEQRGRKSTAA